MTKIEIYDDTYEEIEKIADEENTTIAELIADMLEAFKG